MAALSRLEKRPAGACLLIALVLVAVACTGPPAPTPTAYPAYTPAPTPMAQVSDEESVPNLTSGAIGKYYKGHTLHVSVADVKRVDELRWTTSTRYPAQGVAHDHFYKLQPESDENKLVLLRVKVENHTVASAIVNVDRESAQLRDFLKGLYFPIDVAERAQEAGIPENPSDGCNMPVNPDSPTWFAGDTIIIDFFSD